MRSSLPLAPPEQVAPVHARLSLTRAPPRHPVCRSAYAVLNRRRARVLREDMNEGTGSFTVAAHLPVAESFGLAQELRQNTAGAAAAQLMISHWERLEVDPNFIPTTEDELEEFGQARLHPALAPARARARARAALRRWCFSALLAGAALRARALTRFRARARPLAHRPASRLVRPPRFPCRTGATSGRTSPGGW